MGPSVHLSAGQAALFGQTPGRRQRPEAVGPECPEVPPDITSGWPQWSVRIPLSGPFARRPRIRKSETISNRNPRCRWPKHHRRLQRRTATLRGPRPARPGYGCRLEAHPPPWISSPHCAAPSITNSGRGTSLRDAGSPNVYPGPPGPPLFSCDIPLNHKDLWLRRRFLSDFWVKSRRDSPFLDG